MDFRDNPLQLFAELDAAWKFYSSDSEQLIQHHLSSVVTWRWATDDLFHSHPLFGQADTTTDYEPWRPFARHWLSDDDTNANLDDGCQHGIDAGGRIVLVQRRWFGYVTFWQKGFCDRLQIGESDEKPGVLEWGSQTQDRVNFTRIWHNSDGQIFCIGECVREHESHFRQLEWFEYNGNRCIESVRQCFEIMTEIPHYERDKTNEELFAKYRPLEGAELIGNLVETTLRRRRVKYDYGPSGDLIKAEEFRHDGSPVEVLLFEKVPDRPFAETIDELAESTALTINKAVRKRAATKPYRALALIYSAEHAHCGLPHRVSVLEHDAPFPAERYSFEKYPTELNLQFKRPVLKRLTEFNQRCHALSVDQKFDSGVEAAVSVMRKIAEILHQQLAGTKHVSSDFAVLVIDDHSDVDGFAVPATSS